jgi:hypothetical protein
MPGRSRVIVLAPLSRPRRWGAASNPRSSGRRTAQSTTSARSASAAVETRDGTTHFIFEPIAFNERLAALVPPPRLHQLTYHGVLAPAASWRSDIVPARSSRRRASCGGASPLPLHRYSFAELMKRVFGIDALTCAKCGSERRLIAARNSTEEASGEAITKILDHLELPSAVIRPSPPRAPPRLSLSLRGANEKQGRECAEARDGGGVAIHPQGAGMWRI